MNEELNILINPEASTPLYMQIVERLHRLMVSGKLAPGDRLPAVRELAEDLQVNFNTVARAYRWLEEAGLLSMRQGRGTFVLERPLAARERQMLSRPPEDLTEFTRRITKEARRLGFSPAEVAAALHQASDEVKLPIKISEFE